jgi:DNA-binding transcriptional LysR family regulator
VDAFQREDLQIPHLPTFQKAAELSSFTGAAKALGMTQATVSQRVQALEKALGTPLFKRQRGRVLLTDAGQKLYDHAQRILELHREARRAVTGHDAPVGGELYCAASSIPGEHLLPALLSVFGQKHPHIRVHATISDSMSVMAQVERGQVSLGLVGRKADNANLEFCYLASDRMVLVIPPGHALSERKRVSVKHLSDYPLVLREIGSGLRHCFEKSLEKTGLSLADLRVALELGSNEAIKDGRPERHRNCHPVQLRCPEGAQGRPVARPSGKRPPLRPGYVRRAGSKARVAFVGPAIPDLSRNPSDCCRNAISTAYDLTLRYCPSQVTLHSECV